VVPDWSYHALFKPLLFRLDARAAEKLTLNAVATLAGLPGGKHVLQFFGDMQPDTRVRVNKTFRTPVGLGAGFALTRGAAQAFCEFGFGFIEIGPITIKPVNGNTLLSDGAIIRQNLPINPGLDWFAEQFSGAPLTIPLGLRIAHLPGTTPDEAEAELEQIGQKLAAASSFVSIDTRWAILNWNPEAIGHYLAAATSRFERVLVLIEPTSGKRHIQDLIRVGTQAGVAGFMIGGGTKDARGDLVFGSTDTGAAVALVKELREWAPGAVIIVADAVEQPADAIAIMDSGANFVTVYSGLVFAGPGLPKRINEALVARKFRPLPERKPYALKTLLHSAWIAMAIIGFGLLMTSTATMTVGLTSVILPYDETFVRLQREGFNQISPHLLHFMEHDRVTYAGTAMATGILFLALSIFGIRTGKRWCYSAVRSSAFFGFASFLLFLFFGYQDPLHAFVTLALLPFYIWGLVARPSFVPETSTNLYNDKSWMDGLYGQFLFVCVAAGLMLAGVAIGTVGFSTVFVPDDLTFMHTTATAITADHPNLLPAIGHDRAGFGCALITIGIAVLYMALHGFRQGQGWVWWSLLISGSVALLSTLGIHGFIGYTSSFHLTPVYIGAALWVSGLWFSYRFLCDRP
jgi:dihydroorotate dehydrogenase